ncbi:MAG: helix-turn-helix domain-containing protein [Actinomycetota bacterium]
MSASRFGSQLRRWRRARGLSQLALALEAQVSQRHISFLETDRSRPSREMVLHLGRVLDVPPREQNMLLGTAGHAPAFGETPLEELEHVAATLESMLEAHEPNMAILLDRHWNVVRANRAARTFTSLLFPEPPEWAGPTLNLMRLFFHPQGLRLHTSDWALSAATLLRRLGSHAASYPNDRRLGDLYDEIRSYPGVESLGSPDVTGATHDLLVPLTFHVRGEDISMFTTIATVGDAHDLTLAELRLETFWPLDPDSAQRWRRFMGAS